MNLRTQYSDCGKHMNKNTDVGYETQIDLAIARSN